MSSERRLWLAATAVALLAGCGGGGDDLGIPAVGIPGSFSAQPVSVRAIKVEWDVVSPTGPEQIGYRLERRTNLTGSFEVIPADRLPAPNGQRVTFLDGDVQPDTYYGYRVKAFNSLGEESEYSVVRGARTPPAPGIEVQTLSLVNSDLSDPDGYDATVTGPGGSTEARSQAIGTTDAKRFAPLPVGEYAVVLRNVASLCRVLESAERTATVDDTGLNTVDTVLYQVDCRDPTKGTIKVSVTVTGGGTDDGFTVKLDGIVGGSAVTQSGTISGAGGERVFSNLSPGSYLVTLQGIGDNCTLAPAERTKSVTLAALQDAEVSFELPCHRVIDNPTEGYQLRGVWARLPSGQATYTLTLDMSTFNDPAINGSGPDDIAIISALTEYDDTKLTFIGGENPATTGLANQTAAEPQLGTIAWLNFSTEAQPLTGQQPVIRLVFDVKPGATGTVAAFTTFQTVDDASSQGGANLKPRIIRLDGTLDLSGAGGGGGTAPTAEANGPYTGTAGAAIAFSSAGSAAATGRTIATYGWDFGDGTSSTAANPSKAYAAPGTFTAILTVTDDQGATDTDQAAVTVTASGGGGGGGGGGTPDGKYGLLGTWSAVSAGQVTYTLTFDLTRRDDPAIPGADDLGTISGTTTYDATRLDFVSASNVSGSVLANQAAGEPAPGAVTWLNFNTMSSLGTGTVGVIVLRFNLVGGATGTVMPTTSFGASDDVATVTGTNLRPNTVVIDAPLNLGGGGGGGGGSGTPPTAEANGPYSGTAGVPISFSSGGSAAAAGRTITAYAWSFGDGTTSTQPSPSKTYLGAGTFTATLTVTDDQTLTASDQAQVTVAPAAAAGLTLRSSFGAVDAAKLVTLSLTLDLRTDLPDTPGPESLASFTLDPLSWDPTKLQYVSWAVPAGNAYVVITDAAGGRLRVTRGTVAPANSTGNVTLLEVRFRVVGASGASATTTATVTSLLGSASGTFDYLPATTVEEGALVLP